MIIDPKILGYIFREARTKRKVTLRTLSRLTGITYTYISKIETGAVVLQQHHFTALMRYYKLNEEKLNKEYVTFFDDLHNVLHANLEHHTNRVEISETFLQKYQHLTISKYLPYLHFAELEHLNYSGKFNERFTYLLCTLNENVLSPPFNLFLLLRKLYYYSARNHYDNTKTLQKKIFELLPTIDKKYQPYSNYYLLTSYAFFNDFVNAVRYYDLSVTNFKEIGNMHFAMLSEIIFGITLVTGGKYYSAINFYEKLLENKDYEFSKYNLKAIYFNIGESYLMLGELNNALIYFEKSYKQLPQKKNMFYAMYCYYYHDDYDKALEIADRSVLLDGKNDVYTQLINWFRRFIARKTKRSDSYIKALTKIETNNQKVMGPSLKVALLKLKIDYYHYFKCADQENKYLYEMIQVMKNTGE